MRHFLSKYNREGNARGELVLPRATYAWQYRALGTKTRGSKSLEGRLSVAAYHTRFAPFLPVRGMQW